MLTIQKLHKNVPLMKGSRVLSKRTFSKKYFSIIYEDEYLLACNKPSGLVVHPGTGHLKGDTLIELASGYLFKKGVLDDGSEPALVHRIDRDTSGIILIAKNKSILRQLHDIFRSRDITKEYIAICHNMPPQYEGEIVLGLSKSHDSRDGTKMRVNADGQESRSKYRVVQYQNNISKVEVFLETGKTHQIRVQMAHVGAPIIGDDRYGNPEADKAVLKSATKRLYLHAYKISFMHPVKNKKLTITAPQPAEFSDLLK
ncbi:MAG: RluA family pseudouridine synthase [Fibrobacter sp.]|nr:RluA family pseudouridine synthase [Fibrobacter sp.]